MLAWANFVFLMVIVAVAVIVVTSQIVALVLGSVMLYAIVSERNSWENER